MVKLLMIFFRMYGTITTFVVAIAAIVGIISLFEGYMPVAIWSFATCAGYAGLVKYIFKGLDEAVKVIA